MNRPPIIPLLDYSERQIKSHTSCSVCSSVRQTKTERPIQTMNPEDTLVLFICPNHLQSLKLQLFSVITLAIIDKIFHVYLRN